MNAVKIKFFILLICLSLTLCGCAGLKNKGTEQVVPTDLIIPINISDVLKIPETEVINYFQNYREDFEILGNYLLKNESDFQTRPVILFKGYYLEKIQHSDSQQISERLFREDMVKRITSLNDAPSKSVDFLFEFEDNLYQQGITYLSLEKMAKGEPSKFSYVKEFKSLGGGWYYYIFHYNKVKNEDEFRNLAWGKISEEEKSTVITPKEKIRVILESGKNVGRWIDDRKLDIVVSVQLNTELDGLLGPITMFFDPWTKELIGYDLRY